MAKDKQPKKKTIAAICVVVVLLLIFTIIQTSDNRSEVSLPERLVKGVVAPVGNGFKVLSGKMGNISAYFIDVSAIREENVELKHKVAELQNTINNMREAQSENARLRGLLDMKQTLGEQWITSASTVIGREPNYWYHSIVIDGGEDRGYKVNMPVVNANGLVGRISHVNKSSSEVILLTDTDGAVGAMLENSRTVGVVEPNEDEPDKLKMIYMSYNDVIEIHQTVISSGLGGIYPKGLLIGYVSDVIEEPRGLELRATVEPFVDFNNIENVLVLMYNNGSEQAEPDSSEETDNLRSSGGDVDEQ